MKWEIPNKKEIKEKHQIDDWDHRLIVGCDCTKGLLNVHGEMEELIHLRGNT